MEPSEIIRRKNRILTNKFTGNMATSTTTVTNSTEARNVATAIRDKFQFRIKNNTADTKKIALVPAYYDRTGIETVQKTNTEGVTTTNVTFHKRNTAALRTAGYMVDVILDDGVDYCGDTTRATYVDMESLNPTKSIRDFLEYIKTNPMMLKEMTIISNNSTAIKQAFQGDMEVCEPNPFTRPAERLVELNRFFSQFQFQNDRINIDFAGNELEISDVLLWTINLPAGADISIILRF